MQFGSDSPMGLLSLGKERGCDFLSISTVFCCKDVCYLQVFWRLSVWAHMVMYRDCVFITCTAHGLLLTPSFINSTILLLRTWTHKQPATLSLRRRCEGITAKVLKMLLSIKSLRRRHRAPLLLFMSSLWLISRRAFTREEIQILPPARVWFLVACNFLSKLEPSFLDPDVLTLSGYGCVCFCEWQKQLAVPQKESNSVKTVNVSQNSKHWM